MIDTLWELLWKFIQVQPAYDSTNIANVGETTLYIGHNGINHKVKYQIANCRNITLLDVMTTNGLAVKHFWTILKQNTKQLSSQKQVIRTHLQDLLNSLGKFLEKDYHINVDRNVPPKRTAPRSVPVHQGKAVKEETDKMLASGVLEATWSHHMD